MMADGCFLLVDAAEGPLPQTRFVLRKAFAVRLKPIVIITRSIGRRAGARVLNAVFDLFIELGADDATLEFPIIYASGRQGIATHDLAVPGQDLHPLYNAILDTSRRPEVEMDKPLQMLILSIDHSEYVGRNRHRPHLRRQDQEGPARRPDEARRQAHRRHRRANSRI